MRVRFTISHRERQPEWILAATTLLWGLFAVIDSSLVVPRHAMDSPFFATLLSVMNQRAWGFYAIGVGLLRIVFLIINGNRPRGSTSLRAIGAGLSAIFWSGFVFGALALPWNSGAIFTYGALLLFDLSSLWHASNEVAPAFNRTRIADVGK